MIKLTLKIDKGITGDILQALARGISHGCEPIKEHAADNHGPEAHSKQRYIRRSGELNRGIQQLPVTILGDEAKAGIIARPPYAAPVEEGHDIKRGGKKVGHAPAYPFMKPAMEDESVQDEVLDIVADSIKGEL